MFQKCLIGVVRFVDANKWLLHSRDSAAVSRFVICQDCWQEISLCRLSEATNSDAHMTGPDFMEIAHFYMIDMICTQCMIFVFVFLSMRTILISQIIFIILLMFLIDLCVEPILTGNTVWIGEVVWLWPGGWVSRN